MTGLHHRAYEKGDEYKIVELSKQAFNDRNMGLDYWKWRFEDNIEEKIRVELMFDHDQLVGHYAVSPVKISSNDKFVLTALSNNAMTHPDYWRKGIFTTLARSLHQRIANEDLDFVWSFPVNQASYNGFVHKLNWHEIRNIPTLIMRPENLKHPDLSHTKYKVEAINYFDASFDDLWERLRNEFANHFRYFVVRDSKYLNWRYVDNPKYQYKIFIIRESDSCLGYAITKFYSGEEQLIGDIVDIFCVFDKEVFLSLVEGSISYLSQNASQICCWMNETCQFYKYLKEVGFTEGSFLTHFGVIPLKALEVEAQGHLFDYSNWYITMGDSDVY
jgi:hypothetical protein